MSCLGVSSVTSASPTLSTLWTTVLHAPLSMGFARQGCWSGLPYPPPGNLPNPGIEPASPVSPALQADSLLLSHQGSPSGCQASKSTQLHPNHGSHPSPGKTLPAWWGLGEGAPCHSRLRVVPFPHWCGLPSSFPRAVPALEGSVGLTPPCSLRLQLSPSWAQSQTSSKFLLYRKERSFLSRNSRQACSKELPCLPTGPGMRWSQSTDIQASLMAQQ